MYHEVVDRKNAVFNITSNSPRFRIYRRLLREELNPRAVGGHRELLEGEAYAFVRALKDRPERFLKAIRMYVYIVLGQTLWL